MQVLKHRLVAMMFTDMVGYSAISNRDEGLALELLREHHSTVRHLLGQYGGKEIRTIGDAFFLEFESALMAIECGVAILNAFAERNREAAPGREIEVRIGVHLGEVAVTADDLYGDGVNITARLQALAKPGTLYFSETVHEQVRNKLKTQVIPLGPKTLKNIATPVQVYAVKPGAQAIRGWRLRWQRLRPQFTRFGALAAAVCGTFAATVFTHGWHHHGAEPRTAADPAHSLSGPPRIAVLPFRNISQDPSDEYLSEGMTDELISKLTRVQGIRVLAKDSASRARQPDADVAKVARELRASTLIDGSIRRAAKQLRITVQFIQGDTQETVWSKTFDGTIDRIFDIEKNIASDIARQFQGRALASITAAQRFTAEPQPNSEAYLLYLKGRYAMNRRDEAGLLKGIDYLRKSIDADPGFAPAYGGLATAADLQSYYGLLSPAAASQRIEYYSRQALQLDPNLGEALIALAEKREFHDYDWRSAEEMFKKAVESNPDQPTVHQWYAEFLTYLGRHSEADLEMQKALDIDPLSLVATTAAGVMRFYAGSPDDAIARYLSVVQLDPNFIVGYYWLGRAYAQKKMYPESIAAFQKAVELTGGNPMMLAGLAYGFAVSGEKGKAESILGEMREAAKHRYVSPFDFALVEAGLGHREKTLALLGKAYGEKGSRVISVGKDPAFDALRGSEQFVELERKIGFPWAAK